MTAVRADWTPDPEFPDILGATVRLDGEDCALVFGDHVAPSGTRYISFAVHAPYQGRGRSLHLTVNGVALSLPWNGGNVPPYPEQFPTQLRLPARGADSGAGGPAARGAAGVTEWRMTKGGVLAPDDTGERIIERLDAIVGKLEKIANPHNRLALVDVIMRSQRTYSKEPIAPYYAWDREAPEQAEAH